MLTTLAGLLALPLAALGMDLEQKVNFNIPAQDLSAALIEFSKQARLQVIISDDLTGQTTQGVSGSQPIKQALSRLLEPAGLRYRVAGETSITVGKSLKTAENETHTTQTSGAGHAVSLRLAQNTQTDITSSPDQGSQEGSTGPNGTEKTSPPKGGDREGVLQEVVVTAQKRSERLQDVPVPVTVIGTESLVDSHQLRIQDYYTKIPGLSLTLLGDSGSPSPTIRGITTGGATNPTVGFVVDDVAFSTSTVVGAGHWVPDFDPSELARVEVLRGPQGTLYGANSLGGLVKFVTAAPSTDGTNGRLQAGTSSVKNGDGLGYNVRGSANVPLGDTFAVRVSGSHRTDPGFVDDPVLNASGVNRAHSDSGRVSTRWHPSERLSLQLSALVQNSKRDGESYVFTQPGLKDLQHTALPDTGWYRFKLQAYSAVLTSNLGSAELTSLTGYSINEYFTAIDATLSATLSARTRTRFGVPGLTNPQHYTTRKFSQELRLATPITDRIDWLIGAFYTRESYLQDSHIYAVDPSSGLTVGTWFDARRPSTFDEYAAFTDLTFKITDRFDVQVGGRESRIKFATGAETSSGPWNIDVLGRPTLNFVSANFDSKDDAFTYLVTPRFKVSSDLMLYARLASGYRPGGPNTSALARTLGLPAEYGPDTTQNYELGVKGTVFNRALFFDASLYHIDWKDIQVQLRDPISRQVYFTNAGRAKSQGIEISLESQPFSGVTISTWGAWNDAKLTEIDPTSLVTARSGDRLPYGSRFSGNLSVNQEFPVLGAIGSWGASASYVGDRKGTFFAGTLPRETFPAYTQVDIRAGAKVGSWSINAYVNNVTDRRGVLRGGRDAIFSLPYIFYYIQPRTMGVTLTKTF